MTISEHKVLPMDANGNPIPVIGKPLAKKGYVPAAGSAQTTSFNTGTKFVRVATDTAIHVGYGATATADDDLVSSEAWFAVAGGSQLSFLLA